MNTNVQEDIIEPAKKKWSQTMSDVQGRVSDTARATHQYVHENPWKTIGLVALAACTLGWLMRMATED